MSNLDLRIESVVTASIREFTCANVRQRLPYVSAFSGSCQELCPVVPGVSAFARKAAGSTAGEQFRGVRRLSEVFPGLRERVEIWHESG